MKVRLLEFDFKTANDRIYRKESVIPLLDGLNSQPLYGTLEMAAVSEVDISMCSHYIKNIKIEGKYLVGEVVILDNEHGAILSKELNERVFRSRAFGSVDSSTREVKELEILAFDAIKKEDDTFEIEELSELEVIVNEIEKELN